MPTLIIRQKDTSSDRTHHKKRKPVANDSYETVSSTAVDGASHRSTTDYSRTKKKRKKKKADSSRCLIDLSGVPHQSPILKNDFKYRDNSRKQSIGDRSSKYLGVHFSKSNKKWRAQMMIGGKVTVIGNYIDEERAAIDYARAACKYKVEQSPHYGGLDLSGIPEQPHIRNPKSKSGFMGVKANKKRWEARISINGSSTTLGTFNTVPEAASVYAKAVYFKIQNQIQQPWQQVAKANNDATDTTSPKTVEEVQQNISTTVTEGKQPLASKATDARNHVNPRYNNNVEHVWI